jgi:hypothetical protein
MIYPESAFLQELDLSLVVMALKGAQSDPFQVYVYFLFRVSFQSRKVTKI